MIHVESTELSKAFAKQGLKIPIRNDGKRHNCYCHSIFINLPIQFVLERQTKVFFFLLMQQ